MGSIKGIRRGKYKIRHQKEHVCSRCSKVYRRRNSLFQHIQSKHLNVRVTCTICTKKYISISVRNRHLRKVHGITQTSNSKVPSSPDIVQLTELSYEPDVAFPCMVNILSLKANKAFGFHIAATQDIAAGDVVIATHPFAVIDYLECTGSGCFKCGNVPKSKIQCENCINVFFCSNSCKSSRTHRTKCDKRFDRNDCRIIRLATQIITVVINVVSDIKTLLEFCRGLLYSKKKSKQCRPPYSTYGEILQLQEHHDSDNASKARRVVKHVMRQLESLDSVDTESLERILFNLAYRHVNSILINAFAEENICSKGGVYTRFFMFDVASRLNHSCDPNVEHYTDDDEMTYFVASRTIKAGEQLFINYLCETEFQTTKERKNYLKQHWNFDCTCSKCNQNNENILVQSSTMLYL